MLYGSLFAGKLFQGGLFRGSLFGAGGSDPLAALIAALFGNDEQGGLWLPGPETCFTDDGTTLCTAPGDLVYRMNDLSGRGNHAIQAAEAARPALQQTAGGLWYLDFDGSDDLLGATPFATNHQVMAWTGNVSSAASNQTLICLVNGTADRFFLQVPASATDLRLSHYTTSFLSVTRGITLDANTVLFSSVVKSPTRAVTLRVDTALGSTGASASTVGTAQVSLGGRIGGNYTNMQFFGGAVWGHTAAMSDSSRDQLEAFLAARSGVTLP